MDRFKERKQNHEGSNYGHISAGPSKKDPYGIQFNTDSKRTDQT